MPKMNRMKMGRPWPLVLVGLLLLMAAVGRAQVPTGLVGRWALRQIAYEARRPLSHTLQEELFNSPASDTNAAVKTGELLVEVHYRPDGTFTYTMTRQGQQIYAEKGRYEVQNGQLISYSTDENGQPTVDKQRIIRLTRKALEVEFSIWKPEQQVFQQISYTRLPE